MWYGKGPGVDRCGDVFKHMNHAGTSRQGGVLLVAADDLGAHSSTLPHQSEHAFASAMIQVLYPANVDEYLTLGLHGWAMSRFSGCAVGFKALADTVEFSASVDADPFRVKTIVPTDFVMPEGGLHARLSTDPLGVQARKREALMQGYKIYAALTYARANRLNHVTIDAPKARLGIIASGKSYIDVMEALSDCLRQRVAAQLRCRATRDGFGGRLPGLLDGLVARGGQRPPEESLASLVDDRVGVGVLKIEMANKSRARNSKLPGSVGKLLIIM